MRSVFTMLAVLGVLWCGPSIMARAAGAYPDHPIKLVVTFTPGGITDTLGRIAAEAIQNGLHQSVVVENRPGAGGVIGNSFVARAAPDGYTLLVVPTAFGILPYVYKNLSYDTRKDFAPISLIGDMATVMVVSPSLGVSTVQEFIDLAKKPGSHLSYATSGVGTPSQLSVEYFCSRTGIKLQHVPFNGSAPASVAVMSGDVSMALLEMSVADELVKAGKLKALGVTAPTRHYKMPDTPTIGETVPGFAATSWTGVVGRAGTPKPIIDRLSGVMRSYLETQAGIARLRALGVDAHPTTPEQTAAWIDGQLALWKPVVKAAGIVPQ